METTGPAIIRTVTNFIVAWIVSQPVVNLLDVDDSVFVTLVTAVVGVVYYGIVRFLESKVSPKFSLLLASNKQPAAYATDADTTGTITTR